jgi:hypothetical protein
MFSAEEYTKYNSLKTELQIGQTLDQSAFRQVRRSKFQTWLPAILERYQTIADYRAGSGWLKGMARELGKDCIEIDDIGGGSGLTSAPPVDLLCAITVLEHMTPAEVLLFIETARARCHLLLVTNNPSCLFSHFVLWDDITHVRLYSVTSITPILMMKGYQIDRTFYEDDVLAGYGFTPEQIAAYWQTARTLGPMMLSSPHNYWCVLATTPLGLDHRERTENSST